MNYDRSRETAEKFEEIAQQYAVRDSEAALFYEAMKPWLEKVKGGLLSQPLEYGTLPSRFYFLDGNLRKYRDLESAFSEFAVEVYGGETPGLIAVRKALAAMEPPDAQ